MAYLTLTFELGTWGDCR